MSKVRVAAFGVSLDGFGAGPNQSLTQPLGERGGELMGWFFPTRVFHAMHGSDAGVAGSVDDTFAQHSFENVGAWILGRNMFGPVRGEWAAETWKGWWGDEPPYHLPVFVLTHYPREPLVHARWNDLPLRHGRYSQSTGTRKASRGRQGGCGSVAARTQSGSTCRKA